MAEYKHAYDKMISTVTERLDYSEFISSVFYHCDEILLDGAKYLGVTYKELNVWVFVVLHPLLTISLLLIVLIQQRVHYRTLRKILLCPSDHIQHVCPTDHIKNA